MRNVALLFLLSASLTACGAAPPAPVAPPAPPPVVPEPTVATAAPSASAAPEAPPPPAACPAEMVLVEGDYCTEVKHECIEEWWGKANQKHVCERFEPTAKCVGARVKKRFCVDKYEWPNKEGERPEVMNRFHQAEVKCAAMGKRMCTESEWNFACEGPEMKPFPYGYVRDPLTCNGDHWYDNPDMKAVARRDPTELARLWKGMRSGSQAGCKSDFGVFDMPANADEVVASEPGRTGHFPKFDSIHTGGPWYSGVRNQCRPKVYTHDEGFYYYFLSFRCCAEPDGVPTDPRTPRQRKEGWTMSKVEGIAGFTVNAMKDKLTLKAEGRCTCGEKDILCKTMCGTLLGPGAKDATRDTPRARYDGKMLKGRRSAPPR